MVDEELYEVHIEERADVEEREYRAADIRRYVWYAHEGDIVEVETWAESYPTRTMRIIEDGMDVIGEDVNTGKKFYLVDSYWGGKYGEVGEGKPWLRTVDGFDSAGEMMKLIVHRLVD